jgi:hypothetical protein
MDRAFARNVAAKKRYKGNELDPDAEYDYDGGLEMWVLTMNFSGGGCMGGGPCLARLWQQYHVGQPPWMHGHFRPGRPCVSTPPTCGLHKLPATPRFENKRRRGDPEQQAQRDKARQV